MSKLDTLRESRSAAETAFTALSDQQIAALADSKDLTDEDRSALGAAEARVHDFDAAIEREEAAEARAAKVEEERQRQLGANANTDPAHVTDEARTYDAHSGHSFFRDLGLLANPSAPGWEEARERMATHRNELDRELSQSPRSDEARHIRRYAVDSSRSANGGPERRDSTTANNVTIPYYLTNYVAYNVPGRPFADQCNKQEMPSYGMTVSAPVLNSSLAVASQGGDDVAFSLNNLNSSFATADITTLAGGSQVSVQLLERSGLQSDKAIFEQLTADYNAQVDLFTLTGALTGATSVSYTGTWGAAEFRSKVLGAAAGVETAPGILRSPGHCFLTPTRYAAMKASVDDNGRPLIVDRAGGPMNTFISQEGVNVPEGYAYGDLGGLDVYKDVQIPLTGGATPTYDQAVVAYMPTQLFWEGALIPETLPQATVGSYGAGTLTVLVRVRAYVAFLGVRPASVATINGSAMTPYSF